MTGANFPAPPVATVLLLLGVAMAEATATPARDAAAVQDTLVATVRNVHAEPGGIDVIVGVQLALHLEYYRVTESTRIERAGETVALEDLAPGDLVRIQFHEGPEGRIADSIEVVRPPMRGRAR